MDNINNPMSQGPSVPSPAPTDSGHSHKNWVGLLVFVLVAVLVGVLLIFQAKWLDFDLPTNQINTGNQEAQSFNSEVDRLDSNNLDAEFMDIEADLNNL